jgi:hypothetical protein
VKHHQTSTQLPDVWFIRLPSGRTLRANSTDVVRQYLSSGQIPVNSRVRRSPDEEWAGLDWTEEFADLATSPPAPNGTPDAVSSSRRPSTPAVGIYLDPGSIADRLDGTLLPRIGVRGMLQELLAALDSSLVRGKLAIAAGTALLGGILVTVLHASLLGTQRNEQLLAWGVGGVLLLLLFAVASAVVTRMTYIELSRLRPARRKEMRGVLGWPALRLFAASLLVGGLLLAIGGLRWLPGWLLDGAELSWSAGAREGVAMIAAVGGLLLEVLLWPLAVLGLLLAPILIVEDCSVFAAVRQWVGLLRKHWGRVFLYEALAVAAGGLVTVALALPLLVASQGVATDERLALTVGLVLRPLWGLALAPLLAYLTVANVFIYLNLRYPGAHRAA